MSTTFDREPTVRILDLFCGAGGAGMGYHRAGFEVVGVDINPQPRYPFEFHQGDALEFLASGEAEGFDAIHASPPCEHYARIGCVHGVRGNHPDLIDATRAALIATGLPWVIENVPDAKIPAAVILCGSHFGLGAVGELDGVRRQLRRHRLFEASFAMLSHPCTHRGEPVGVYGNGGPQRANRNRGYMGSRQERRDAMGIDWMDNNEIRKAIPPAYTQFIGEQLMRVLT